MALAKSISNAINDADIRRNWAKVASKPGGGQPRPNALLEMGVQSLEEDPFDGIDLLNFESALLAQTLLDHEEKSPTGLTRAMLAKMAEELFADDDDLDVWSPQLVGV
jgi:hypothetical protein